MREETRDLDVVSEWTRHRDFFSSAGLLYTRRGPWVTEGGEGREGEKRRKGRGGGGGREGGRRGDRGGGGGDQFHEYLLVKAVCLFYFYLPFISCVCFT